MVEQENYGMQCEPWDEEDEQDDDEIKANMFALSAFLDDKLKTKEQRE